MESDFFGQIKSRSTCIRMMEQKRKEKDNTSCVKHGVEVWACMAAGGTGSLVFIDNMIDDRSNKVNSGVYKATPSAHSHPHAGWVERRFTASSKANILQP